MENSADEQKPAVQIQQPPARLHQREWGPLRDIPFKLTVEVGRTRMKVRDILSLGEDSTIVTTKLSGEPMDVSLKGEIFARAEIIIIKDKLWARLTKIVGGDR